MPKSIESEEDREWLVSTHLRHIRLTPKPAKILGRRHRLPSQPLRPRHFAVAIIHGNEDSPTRVELFAKNHYRCRPWVFVDTHGTLQHDEKASRNAGELRPRTTKEKEARAL